MFRRLLASRRASPATYSEGTGSFSNEPTLDDLSIRKEESEKERLVFKSNDEDDNESVVDEELSFIVDFLGSDHIAEVQSVPLLMETLKRVKKQHTRTVRVDFVIRDGILKVSNVQQGALLITAPLYAVALCAQEQLRGFDSTFAINITRKRLHMCHVFQAGSRLEASSIVKSVAVAFKSVGRLLKDRRERARTIESTSLHSAERFRADSTGSQGRERMRTDSEGSREKTRIDGDHHNSRKRHQTVSAGRGGKSHLPTLPSEESLETNGSGTGSTGHRASVIYAQVHSSASRDTAAGRQLARNNENEISAATDLQDVVNMFSRESISDLEHSVPPSDEELPRKEWSDVEERGDLVCFHEAVDAISRGNKAALECLLNEGLSVNAENKNHLSLLHYAVLSEKLEIVSLLLERGADPNCEGPRDQTPLHCAAARGNRGITKLLLSHEANVRAKDRQFRTPLHLCAGNLQNLEVSYVLVEHGARIEENDLEGTRPIDLHLELREMQNRLVQSVCEAFAVSDLARSRSDSGSSSVQSSNARISRDVSSSRDYSPSSTANKAIVNSKALGRVRSASFNRSDETSMRSHRRAQKGRKITENHEVNYQADAAETLRNVINDVEEKIASEAQMATSKEVHRSRSDSVRSGSAPHFRQSSHADLPKSVDTDRVPHPYSSHRFKGTVDTAEKPEDFTDSDCSVESGTLIPNGLQGSYTDARLSKPMEKSTRESEDFRLSHRRTPDDSYGFRELNGSCDKRRCKPDQWSDNVLSARYATGLQNLQRSNTVGSRSNVAICKKAIDPWESTDSGQLSRRAVEEVTSSDEEEVEQKAVTESRRGMSTKEERSSSGSYSKLFNKKDPTQDALSLLVTLSANPECHSSILQSLCLPKPSSRLLTIAFSSNDVEQRQQISTLMGNLFSPSRPDTKSKAVQAGLLKTVIDLLEAPDPIQATCLSILRDLLQSENDKDYTAAVTSVPIDPLLSLIEKSQNKEAAVSSSVPSNLRLASKVCQSSLDSIPPQRGRLERVTSQERRLQGKKSKTAYCQDDISIDNHPKHAVFTLRDTRKANSVDTRHGSVSGVLQGSCAESLEGTPIERSSLFDGKENVHSDPTRRGERSGDAFWEIRGESFSIHNKMKRSARFFSGFDLMGNNISSTFHAKHVAMKMLGAASTNPKIQAELSKKRALQLLLQSAGSLDPEMASLAVCALANVALNFDTHPQLDEEKIQDDMIPLLEHKDVRVRYHAARGLIYLGNFDVEDVYLYHLVEGLPDTQTALFSEDASGQIRYVRGTTLEHLLLCLTTDISVLWDGSSLPPPSPSEKKAFGRNAGTKINGKYFPSEQQITSFVLTMYQTFTHPLIFMRLLLHRFHDPVHFRVFEELDEDGHGVFFDRFGPLPSVHARLMRIWITWLENFPEDFSKHTRMIEEISELIEPMRGVGGPYEPCADKLESLIEIVKDHKINNERCGNKEIETQHDMLYEQCQNAIVSGALPCTEDDYVYLGGLQLYVEDICEFGPDFPLRLSTIDSITPTRIKQSIYPSAASSKVMVRRIRAYYEYFCELMPTERNARHNYIDCCQGLDGYGCRFFKLKQKVPSKGGKKHVCVPRQFGVSSKRIAILDEKTKAPIEKWSFRDLRTWEPSEDNLSVRFHFKTTVREYQFDNKSLLKELTNYILTCTMEINYQGLRNIDTNPWSRTCEEAGTWGAPAVRKYLQQLRSESEGSPDGTLNRGSPSGRERSRTCVPVTEKKPMSPFSRCQSYSARMVSKSVPAKAGESASEALKSIRGGDGPETSGSSGSSGMTVDQVLKNSLYLESLVSGVSGEPSTASGRPRRSRGTSFATVKEVDDTEPISPGMAQISEFSEKLPMLPGGVDSLQNGILNYLPSKGSSSKIVTCQCPPDADLPNLNRQDFSAFELLQHPKELARQITLIDHELFRAMSSRDIQEKLSLGIIRKIIRPGESPHTVERVAHRFNQLSNWISFCIVSERNIERRAQLFVNFIETAKQCLELRNYNAVMSIVVAALGSAPVRRLQATKELIQPEFLNLLSKLEILMDTKNNYKRYREALRTSPTPAVPYFGIYLKDLTFISDGNPDYFRGGLINVNKRRLVYVLLDEVHRFQRKRYNIQEVAEIRRYLLSRPQTSEDELHRMSHEIEPSVHQRVLDDAPGPVPIAVEKRASIASANIRHPPSNKIMTKRMLSVTKTCQGATIV